MSTPERAGLAVDETPVCGVVWGVEHNYMDRHECVLAPGHSGARHICCCASWVLRHEPPKMTEVTNA